MRAVTAVVIGLAFSGPGVVELAAQAAVTPQTYSFSELNSMIAPDMTVKVYRDGAREILLQTRPASPDSPKGYRGGMYFDFQAHFQYTWDETDGTPNCGRQDYPESAAPALFDVVSGSTELMADFAKGGSAAAGRDAVNGTPATIYLVADTAHKTSAKLWLAEKTNYLLKVALSANGAPPVTYLEVKSLSFAKPAAAAFKFPASCK
jgi:hypothetical protein